MNADISQVSSFQNHAPIQNQAGQQIIYGNVIFDDYGPMHKRSRFGFDGDNPELRFLDDNILASLAFALMSDRRSKIEPPHNPSCQWLFRLRQYKIWKAKPRGLLWIKGLPGSGKSTIMSHLYSTLWSERSPEVDIHLEFFFSARGAPLQRTPLGMIRSLLNQIFYQDLTSRILVRKLYREKCALLGGGSNATWEWQLPELKKLFIDVISSCAQRRPITIFIDALDEAGQRAASDTAHYFHTLNDHIETQAGGVKTCISCRHYPVLSTAQAVEVHVEQHNRGDIEAYVRDYLHLDNLSSDLTIWQNKWPELLKHLVDTTRGIFQWARLVVPMVGHWMSDGYSPKSIRKRLTLVPKELQDVYKHIIENVIDDHHRTQSLRLFQWVSLSMRPLSVTEIRYALAAFDTGIGKEMAPSKCHDTEEFISSDEVAKLRIKSWSGGLIEVVDNVYVQVIHQSVNDYLWAGGLKRLFDLDPRARTVDGSNQAETEASKLIRVSHGSLYWSCLKYLSLEYAGPGDFGKVDYKSDGLEAHFAKSRSPFLEYSAVYCFAHAQKAGVYRSQSLEIESRFLGRNLSAWLFNADVFDESYYLHPDMEALTNCTNILQVAAAAGLEDLARHRIRCKDDLESADTRGWTALHFAASQGHFSVVKLLIAAGADFRRGSQKGTTPLLLAAHQGYTDMFSWLVKQGADVNVQNKASESSLNIAAKRSHLAICKLCIDAGADVNARGRYFSTALQVAAHRGNEAVVSLLLEAGADIRAWGVEYGNAYQAAKMEGNEGVIRLLLATEATAKA